MRGMGRMDCSSTLLISHPRSHCTALGFIAWYSLGGKSYFLVHIGTPCSMLFPTTWPANFTLKLQGNWHPCASRTLSSCCSTGNRRHKPATSVSPDATPQNWASWSPCERLGPGTPAAHRLGSPEPSQQQSNWTEIPGTHAGNQAPGLLLPIDLVPPCLQHYCTTLLEPRPGKQAPEILMSEGMAPP
jgi:hypothetical protein